MAFAMAVFGGVLGCLLLLLKKSIAGRVFIASLAGIVVQMSEAYFMSGAVGTFGPGGHAMSAMILGAGIFLVWYARLSRQKGWIS